MDNKVTIKILDMSIFSRIEVELVVPARRGKTRYTAYAVLESDLLDAFRKAGVTDKEISDDCWLELDGSNLNYEWFFDADEAVELSPTVTNTP